MKAIVRAVGEGEVLEVMGSRLTIRVRSEESGGTFSVVEFQAAPGFKAPPVPHRHIDLDWYALVLEGEMAIELDGVERRVAAGGIAVIPRGVAFRWWNASDHAGVRWQGTYSPGGFERFFVQMVEQIRALGHPPTPAEMAAIAVPLWAEHHVEVVPRSSPE